jgi:hypothetical protein
MFVCLLPAVRYRVALGFAFVDDGAKVFKFDAATFLGLSGIDVGATDPGLLAFVDLHPSIFDRQPARGAAIASWRQQEV